ncbi:unnamed protein product [Pieris macdunnoughi]|uniref:Uncharacterized protein n=1 Tax=Pieris macdunnoughi TaxID=345717 RepID=A0A821R3Q9_9NEOP|nr:unnamed protein product [Pieris macdunnoughi]
MSASQEDLIEDNEKVLDDGSEVSAEEGIGNQAHVNEVPETPESQLDESQVTMTQESRNPASAATKFKHPVPIKKAKKINNILFSADRGEFDWERGYLTDSNSSQASTPASTPNQNVANSEKSQHSDDFSDLVRFNNL